MANGTETEVIEYTLNRSYCNTFPLLISSLPHMTCHYTDGALVQTP